MEGKDVTEFNPTTTRGRLMVPSVLRFVQLAQAPVAMGVGSGITYLATRRQERSAVTREREGREVALRQEREQRWRDLQLSTLFEIQEALEEWRKATAALYPASARERGHPAARAAAGSELESAQRETASASRLLVLAERTTDGELRRRLIDLDLRRTALFAAPAEGEAPALCAQALGAYDAAHLRAGECVRALLSPAVAASPSRPS
jgi:hypothetical protein